MKLKSETTFKFSLVYTVVLSQVVLHKETQIVKLTNKEITALPNFLLFSILHAKETNKHIHDGKEVSELASLGHR